MYVVRTLDEKEMTAGKKQDAGGAACVKQTWVGPEICEKRNEHRACISTVLVCGAPLCKGERKVGYAGNSETILCLCASFARLQNRRFFFSFSFYCQLFFSPSLLFCLGTGL